MAPPGLSYVVGLVDRMSAPAKQASGSVAKLTSDLRSAKSHLSLFQSQFNLANKLGDIAGHQRYGDAITQAREKVYALTKETEGLTAATGGKGIGFAASIGPVVAGVTVATAALTTMAATYGGVAKAALKAAFAEQSFERQSRAVLGGGAEGDAAFALIDGLAKKLPQSRRELVAWTNDLQDMGITSLGVIRRGVNALAGAQALGGEGGGAQLMGILRRVQEGIQTTGHIKMADKQLANLAKTGVNVDDVAKELGISTLKLQQNLKAGTEDAGTFGNALLEAINRKGRGPIKAMMFDLDNLEKKALELGSRFFKNVDVEPVVDALERMFFLMDQSGAAGSDLEKGISRGTSGIVRAFASVTDSVTVAYLKVAAFALNSDTELIKVETRLRSIGGYLAGLPGRINAFVHGDFGALALPGGGPGKTTRQAVAGGAEALATAATAVGRARLVGALKGEDLQAAGDKLSESLAAGIHQGLISKEQAVRLQAIALGKAAVDGTKKGADVHSPSRATFWVGGQIGAGLVGGMRSSAGNVGRAASYLGEHATRASLYGGRGADARSAPQGRGGVHIDRVENNITAPGGVTDATSISAWGLSVALEREQLMAGA